MDNYGDIICNISNGYTGPLCKVCMEGFYKIGDNLCGKCNDAGIIVFFFIIETLFQTLMIFGMVYANFS